MSHYTGRVQELLLEPYQNASARLQMPADALPRAGQYLQVHDPADPEEVLPSQAFPVGPPELDRRSGESQLAVSVPLRAAWQPGTELELRGPLGQGFKLPRQLRRLALVALGSGPGRLLPLVSEAARRLQIVLFAASEPANLSLEVEVQPFKALNEGLAWADFLALDVPVDRLDELPSLLEADTTRPPAGQALVHVTMPCGGLADCGLCTVQARRGTRLVCKQGPVFSLDELL